LATHRCHELFFSRFHNWTTRRTLPFAIHSAPNAHRQRIDQSGDELSSHVTIGVHFGHESGMLKHLVSLGDQFAAIPFRCAALPPRRHRKAKQMRPDLNWIRSD